MNGGSSFVRRDGCPACGSLGAMTLLSVPYDRDPLLSYLRSYYTKASDIGSWLSGAVYGVERCTDCSLVFQRHVASGELLSRLYDDWLNFEYDPERDGTYQHAVQNPASTRDGHELLTVARVLRRPVASLRVLDYGMGWGLWARIARGIGARAYGHELSETRSAYVRSHGVELVDAASLRDLAVDFINADQVFEHLSDPYETASLLAGALGPGGVLKIAVPRADDIERRLRRPDWNARKFSRHSLNAIQPLEHVNCFSERSLARLLRRVGLERMQIPLGAYGAFLFVRGGIPSRPVPIAKAVARPLYNRFSRNNLYAWFRKPEAA